MLSAWSFAAAAQVASPLPTPPAEAQTIPAKANEGPTVIGPLPVAPAVAPDSSPSAAPDAKADAKDPLGVGAMDDADGDGEPESLAGALVQTFIVLGLVVALIYVSLNYGLRRLMGVRGMPSGRSSLVQVVERIPLDPKRSLFVLKAAGEYLLVGGSDTGLQLISKLDPAEVTRVMDEKRSSGSAASPFLQKLLSRNEVRSTPPTEGKPTESEKL